MRILIPTDVIQFYHHHQPRDSTVQNVQMYMIKRPSRSDPLSEIVSTRRHVDSHIIAGHRRKKSLSIYITYQPRNGKEPPSSSSFPSVDESSSSPLSHDEVV